MQLDGSDALAIARAAELLAAGELVEPFLDQRFEAGPQAFQHLGLERLGEQAAHREMSRIIAAQHDALRGQIHGLVHHAAVGRREHFGQKQGGPYRIVLRNRPRAVAREPDRRPKFTQGFVVGIGIEDDIVIPEVAVPRRSAGRERLPFHPAAQYFNRADSMIVRDGLGPAR